MARAQQNVRITEPKNIHVYDLSTEVKQRQTNSVQSPLFQKPYFAGAIISRRQVGNSATSRRR